jgi:AhpD family alkylhydroperoxidase
MTSTQSSDPTADADQRPGPRVKDLIPIAVVIAAGCESCADNMVRRALDNGATKRQVQYTLGVIAHLRSSDCFLKAVGVEVAERMDRPLAAARNALRASSQRGEACACCVAVPETRSAEFKLV